MIYCYFYAIFLDLSLLLPVFHDNNDVKRTNIKSLSAKKINSTTYEILFNDKNRLSFDFYGDNIFRVFQDNNGGIIREPEAKPSAQILVNNPRKTVNNLTLAFLLKVKYKLAE